MGESRWETSGAPNESNQASRANDLSAQERFGSSLWVPVVEACRKSGRRA